MYNSYLTTLVSSLSFDPFPSKMSQVLKTSYRQKPTKPTKVFLLTGRTQNQMLLFDTTYVRISLPHANHATKKPPKLNS